MDLTKFEKLEEYTSILGKKALDEEKNAEIEEAISTYLKLVDVLLVMAEVSPSYPCWVKCTTSAENYQKKIRTLITRVSLKKEESNIKTA